MFWGRKDELEPWVIKADDELQQSPSSPGAASTLQGLMLING